MLLDLEESSLARSLALSRAARSIIEATELVLKRRLEEFSTLRASGHLGDHAESKEYRGDNNRRQLFDQARAARETLLAERKLATRCVREAKLRLRASYDVVETVETKLVLVEQRLGALMAEMTRSGLVITLPHQPSELRHWPPEEFCSDSDGSDLDMDVVLALESNDDDDDDDGDGDGGPGGGGDNEVVHP